MIRALVVVLVIEIIAVLGAGWTRLRGVVAR